jgi:hypothetical protein
MKAHIIQPDPMKGLKAAEEAIKKIDLSKILALDGLARAMANGGYNTEEKDISNEEEKANESN